MFRSRGLEVYTFSFSNHFGVVFKNKMKQGSRYLRVGKEFRRLA